jgi:2-(1,2-epoxy-1,2-dihydrophenyl)acetyl-CoA isomerase
MPGTVLYDVDGAIATITLNRPDRLNAMNLELLAEMVATLERVASDDAIRAVIVTGAGRGFTAGGDMDLLSQGGMAAAGIAEGEATLEGAIANLRSTARSSQLLHDMPKVTIAAINGPCAGAGLSWACACDLRYASEAAVFNTAFATAGPSGDMGGHWTLPRIVGPAKARELFLLAERFDAAEAHRIGLVSSVHAPDDLLPQVRKVAERVVNLPPLTIRAIKENQNEAMDLPFGEMLDRESARHVKTGRLEDSKEAATAFLEKRPPVFHGR